MYNMQKGHVTFHSNALQKDQQQSTSDRGRAALLMCEADLGAEGVSQEVVGQAAHFVAVVHQRAHELVEQLPPPLHVVLQRHNAMNPTMHKLASTALLWL